MSLARAAASLRVRRTLRDMPPNAEFVPLSKRPQKMGIITERRQPPRVVNPRQPLPRAFPKPERHNPNTWAQMQRLAHARWDMKIGQRVRAAEAHVDVEGKALDALDQHLVDIQRERRARLNNIQRQQQVPVVQRLLGPPVVVEEPKDALAQYMAWVAAQALPAPAPVAHNAGTRVNWRARPSGVVEPGMPTKMGLHYARRE